MPPIAPPEMDELDAFFVPSDEAEGLADDDDDNPMVLVAVLLVLGQLWADEPTPMSDCAAVGVACQRVNVSSS